MKTIEIGSAKSEPGKVTYGFINTLTLPTGIVERIPVLIAQGMNEGPTFFLTANIHGQELTGIAVIHELVTESLARELKGTIVALPTINPSGLRQVQRSPEFDDRDPNRLFPEGKFAKEEDEEDEDRKYPRTFEQVAKKIYSYLEKYADFHIDFHNHYIRSIPYSILDRVFYEDESEKEEAERLCEKQKAMVDAFGVFKAAEFPPKKYLKLKYHRSFSGAALNSLRIPAITIELGGNSVIFPEIVTGSVKGARNVLRWAGMLEDPSEKITEFPLPNENDELVRRCEHPRSKHSGIIKFLVGPGDKVKKGQPVASITDIFGRSLGDGYIRSEHDGYMIALQSKITVYPNDAIAEMGIKNDEPLVVPIPVKKE
ncbi:MAG: succinylglutamate desuccinylase/aspartoacylase family protein [Candidatus Hodarchaeota archaeon]